MFLGRVARTETCVLLTLCIVIATAWATPEMIPEQPTDLTGRTAPPIQGQLRMALRSPAST
jgi:hypothetical protein